MVMVFGSSPTCLVRIGSEARLIEKARVSNCHGEEVC